MRSRATRWWWPRFPPVQPACLIPCGAAPVVLRNIARLPDVFDPVLVSVLLWQTFHVRSRLNWQKALKLQISVLQGRARPCSLADMRVDGG